VAWQKGEKKKKKEEKKGKGNSPLFSSQLSAVGKGREKKKGEGLVYPSF